MKYIKCYLPDVNFKIYTLECNLEIVERKIHESVIRFNKIVKEQFKCSSNALKSFIKELD